MINENLLIKGKTGKNNLLIKIMLIPNLENQQIHQIKNIKETEFESYKKTSPSVFSLQKQSSLPPLLSSTEELI
jgi:hypothetical protein